MTSPTGPINTVGAAHGQGHEVYASVSIGITLGSERYEQPEQVLLDADIAMYQAKGRGSASSEIFDTKMHANILDRIQIEADLHGAVDHKGIGPLSAYN